MRILLTGPVPEWVQMQLTAAGHQIDVFAADALVDENIFSQTIPSYDVYVSGGLESMTAKTIAAAKNLKGILFLGVDYEAYIDATAAKAHNIPIYNTPGANAQAVAELALAHMLLLSRRLPQMLQSMAGQTWQAQTGTELSGKTLGLLGSGAIAQRLAAMASGLNMNVLYWTRSGPKKDMPGTYQEKETVLKSADILSLHLPQTAGTVLGTKEFALLQPHALLMNTSPAGLVDADALYTALTENTLAQAAFDPFYKEGEQAWSCPESKLLQLGPEKFILTPHAGWRTREADDNMFNMTLSVIQNLTTTKTGT